MPGPITYAAVALLARDRLTRLQSLLRSKIEHRPTATDLERQVAYLAENAVAAMNRSQPTVAPPARLYGPAQGDQVAKFLFLGAVGPEFTAFAAQFAPLQRWLRDTLHKGTPDEHHEQALAYSTDFALEFWRRVGPAITRELPTQAARGEALAQMRAYVLGHCCHIATDVVSSPYVDALEARLGEPGRPKLNRTQVISAIETEVLNLLFAPTAPPTGHEVDSWWPEPALVPKPFYTAFREALEAVYGAGAQREGGAPYEAMRTEHAPPALSSELLEDGYRSFRMALGMGSTWSLGQWLGFTSFLYLPALVALPIAAKLPQGKDAFRDDKPADHDADAALFEAINLPFAVGAVIPLAFTLAMNLSSLGAEGPVIFGWVSAAAQVICAIVFFATLGSAGVPKWLLLFALPLAIELAFIVYTLTQVNQDNPKRWLLALSGLSHLSLGAIFALLFAAFLHRAPEALNDDEGGAFAGWFILWFFILGAFWVATALLMRYLAVPIPARPGGTLGAGLTPLPAGTTSAGLVERSTVQLIDEAMLSFAGPLDEISSPAARYYPTDRRPLLKLWWTGGGAPTVLAQHDRLVFDLGGTTRTVFAPAVPMTLADFMAYLKATVRDGGGQARLEARLFYADQAAYEVALLPPGLAFAQHGDEELSLFENERQALEPRPLGDSEDAAYVLHSAPRRAVSIATDRQGPLTAASTRARSVRGAGTLTSDPAPGDNVLRVAGANPSPMRRFFRVGDFVEAPYGDPTAPRRAITSVDSNSQITVATAFPAPLAGASFGRVVAVAGSGTLSSGAAPNAHILQVAGATRLADFLRPGDVIEAPFGVDGAPRRVVVSVASDTQITVSSAFPAALAAQPFGRLSRPSDFETPPATWQVQSLRGQPNQLQGVNTQFGALFRSGDTLRVIQSVAPPVHQDRTISQVVSDTLLEINLPLTAPLQPPVSATAPAAVAAAFQRQAEDDKGLYGYLASSDDTVFAGQSLMNEAADLAALLCLGATTHLLSDTERDKSRVGGNTSLNRAYQVFRNWNLDRRRVNEWRMLVQGGAVSEKAGRPEASDFAMGSVPSGWTSPSPAGEAIANRYGWVPVMRHWLDMARRTDSAAGAEVAFRAGEANNRDLSRAMAFLLDQAPTP